ncbi:hypothetical protein I317_04417 [Kwoniella heveanensis CBS 569]|nr:hypothetical protein I317_04417 [Kwoniella heveanensis CBS 569]
MAVSLPIPLALTRRRRSSHQHTDSDGHVRSHSHGDDGGGNGISPPPSPPTAGPSRTSFVESGPGALSSSRPTSPSIPTTGSSSQSPNGASTSNRASSVDTSSQSILALFKEDYISARVYMKELDYKQALRSALRRHMYKWYAILIIAIVLTALITVKHETVVEFCEPVTRRVRAWPGGWLIPIAILIVVSFPPLVGHEIIGILCGLVWGLGIGFAILAAGTFLGEIATWIAFKWCCQGRAAKFEKKNKLYASLTQLIREKSFMFTLVLRFSAVPGHIVTAVSASAGADFWMYLAAAFLTLPKQFTIVYLGKAFGTQSRKNTIISICTTVLTLLGTIVAAVYIYYQMRIVMRRNAALTLPTISEGSTTVTMTEYSDDKRDFMGTGNNIYARRPWLVSNNSTLSTTGYRTPTRSWSMPGHMNEEELREWVEEMKYEQAATAQFNDDAGISGKVKDGRATPLIQIDANGDGASPYDEIVASSRMFDNLPPVFSPMLEVPPRLNGFGSSSPSGTSTPYYAETDGLVPDVPVPPSIAPTDNSSEIDLNLTSTYTYPPTSTPTPPKRGESSTPRPIYPGTDSPRRGGREIADEADAYAIARGARRPDYGRMRGDSRAALLGRPVDDAALEMGGGSWRRDYTRSRGDSGAALIRPNLDDADNGLGRAIESWKRDYGRSRGESGAAILGRPKDEDLGLISRPSSVVGKTSGAPRKSESERLPDVGKKHDSDEVEELRKELNGGEVHPDRQYGQEEV